MATRGPRKTDSASERRIPFPSRQAICNHPYNAAQEDLLSLGDADAYHYMRTELEAKYIDCIFMQFQFPVNQPALRFSLPHNGLSYCNKAIPLFVLPGKGCHRSLHRLTQIAVLAYVYRRTFRPYQTDIEYDPFLVKLLSVPDALPTESESMAIGTVVKLHRTVCHSLETVFEKGRFPYRMVHPLFKSMMITIPMHDYRSCGQLRNIKDLRAFITIIGEREGIKDHLRSSPCNIGCDFICHEGSDVRTVRTTLEAAISFAIECDDRFKDNPDVHPDPVQSTVGPADAARLYGKVKKGVGREDLVVVGPSSRWVDTRATRFQTWTGTAAQDRILEKALEEELCKHSAYCGLRCRNNILKTLPGLT
ncbi:hypothetical protein ACHAPU_003142 [Fusarium lateritium]